MRRRGAPSESRLKNALDEDEFHTVSSRRSSHSHSIGTGTDFKKSSVMEQSENSELDNLLRFREDADDPKKETIENSRWFGRKSSTSNDSEQQSAPFSGNSASSCAPPDAHTQSQQGSSTWWNSVAGSAGSVAGAVAGTAGMVVGAAGAAAASAVASAKGSASLSSTGSSAAPPNTSCHACHATFSLVKLRYPCPNCELNFCYYCLPSSFKHRIPRLRMVEPTVVCEECFYRTCVQTCGGRCFSLFPVIDLKAFLTKHRVDHRDCVEKEDLIRKINGWGKLDKLKNSSKIPSAVPMAHDDAGLEYLSVKELREVLDNYGVKHNDCIEKDELVTRLRMSISNQRES